MSASITVTDSTLGKPRAPDLAKTLARTLLEGASSAPAAGGH